MTAPQSAADQLADQLAAAQKDCWAAYHNIENDNLGYVTVRDKHADLFDKALATSNPRLHLAVWDIANSLQQETWASGVGVDAGWGRLAKRAESAIKNTVGVNHIPDLRAKAFGSKIADAVIDFLDASHNAQPDYTKLRQDYVSSFASIIDKPDVDLLLNLRAGAAVVLDALTAPTSDPKNAGAERFWGAIHQKTAEKIAALAGPAAAPVIGLPDRPASSGGVYSLDNPHA